MKPYTRLQILLYTLVLALISVGISFSSLGGIFYFISALILNGYLIYLAIRVYYQTEPVSLGLKMKYEKKLFLFSISYLFVLFGMILLEALIDRFQIASVNFQLTSIFF